MVAAVLVAAAVGSLARVARATEVRFFRQQNRQEFVAGELNGLAIDAEGALRRAVPFKNIATLDEPYVFTAVVASDGFWLGTGNSGRLLRVAPSGEVETVWTAPEPEIFALWVEADGSVLVGTSPNGKLYRVTEQGATVVFDPEETYIWAITRAPWGELLVATGDEGRLYAVASDGEGRLLYDSAEPHLRSLLALDSSVLIGTSGDGLILTVDANDKLRTLYDADQSEVLAFVGDEAGGWYAAAISSEASFSNRPRETSNNGDDDSKQDDEDDDDSEVTVEVSAGAQAEAAGVRSAILHGSSRGVRRVSVLNRETIYCLAWIDGRLWVGTGVEGNVYSLTDGTLALEAGFDDRQVVGLFGGAAPALVTTNGAAVYRAASEMSASGSYTSSVLDASAPARFGSLVWRGEVEQSSAVEFSLRSGFSSDPDATWSDWSSPAAGSELALAALPAGRFVQWRLELGAAAGPAARISSVRISYRQQNTEPQITRFVALDPGQVLMPATFSVGDQLYEPAHPDRQGIFTRLEPVAGANGSRLKRLWRRGFLTLRWEAEDANEDQLTFGLSFRPDSSVADWLPMAEELDELHYGFDSTALPDGLYRFQLTASDRSDNAADAALENSRTSEPVLIDNSPPSLLSRVLSGEQLELVVGDELSPLRGIEASLDAREWISLVPADGLLDGRRESVTLDVPAGTRLVLLRVMDAAFNTVTFDLRQEVGR